ncbi:putative polypeptide N-acetylgalactosaminyltransferase 9 isoform X1 [Vespa mandarinia]|uniref:putative polypeptide N-acetylgalactosaminyltransferase 9 isoform X1 n=1 Tax=Vespa mandarinia TaxID=7446 RepID=UPI00160AA66C|nr:putative polypeptide N-acetylgalactosaminyltransferase 9 isoform X1 [Vespa mandarinia]XP_035734871.1 putative polypeptide N-acetylgalactosaminyltransferase 9 isoform X1 [Vespa mandarinia]XP_035734881.1 putative polypeptide N-acetylgalactosaminyltransferase 9 isoform X1 [Vespa mandarinia]XP_035734890.1 putative polypeptide N-acetylgalactosaminyltransferase 9 isoform X1 [Vespa mandarinia]XP_035734897.1 putative polypeptide N-acetylgalactosaminyltransferase 9 isoform X1 [Vespa mandarinia]XP_03
MGFPRRRSLWLKVAVLATAVWITVCFLLYTEDRAAAAVAQGLAPSGVAAPPQMANGFVPPALPLRKETPGNVLNKAKLNQAGLEQGGGVLVAPRDPDIAALGEMGRPVILPTNLTAEIKKLVDDGWVNNAFNQYASDLISVHRTLPDPRDQWCKEPGRYLKDLPPTAVIICFHNEAWSVLLRTVHSVLDRSPDQLIQEIILVDDFSDMPHLKRQLEDYMMNYPKVKIIRAQKREGLIRARLLGASAAKAPVLTYLDSHCECTEGWLEPLLDRIARDPTTVVCPVIDVIDDTTLEYHWRDSGGVNVGGFDWNLQFNWHAVPEREKKKHKNPAEPVWSPTMAGGLFSIDRAFFEKLGTYDSGFDIWGGENLELSFKTWMCGGTLEIVPCSHVGHIFRKRSPYKWRSGVNVLKRNSIRLSEVWLDEYAKYYYQRIGHDKGNYGDVSERKALRKKLGCKSFKWYLDNIYPELFIPGEAVASGEVRNLGEGGNTCLDSPARKADLHKAAGLYPCHRQGGNQYWMLSKIGEIRRDESCLDYSGQDVILYPCHGSKGNQQWIYNSQTKQIRHGSSDKCLAITESKQRLLMEECSPSEPRQRWSFENYDPSKL